MSKKKTGKLRGCILTAGAAAAVAAGLCLRPGRGFLLAVIKKTALLFLQARRCVTGNLSGDWRQEAGDVYFSFDNGILYVTDRKGFARKDWKTGSYDLYRNTDDPAGGYTLIARYDGKTTEYGFEQADDETVVFTRGGERFVFKSIRY
jgi:hypothetical protein